MKNLTVYLFAVTILLGACKNNNQTVTVQPPTDTTEHILTQQIVMSTLWFQRSAEARASYYQAYTLATLMLDKHLADNKSKRPKAVVLDIDETVLNNSPFEVNVIETNATYSSETWGEWCKMEKAEPLPGVLDFLNHAISKKVDIFYISNRKQALLETTVNNLKAKGFPFADTNHVLLRKGDNDKTPRRDHVAATHDILLLVGDNLSDFSSVFDKRQGDMGWNTIDSLRSMFGNRYIMLPNPMYGDWEKVFYDAGSTLTPKQKDSLRRMHLIGYDKLR